MIKYSFEKRALHYRVLSNDLHKASLIAQKLAAFEMANYYPVERAKLKKKQLQELINNISNNLII